MQKLQPFHRHKRYPFQHLHNHLSLCGVPSLFNPTHSSPLFLHTLAHPPHSQLQPYSPKNHPHPILHYHHRPTLTSIQLILWRTTLHESSSIQTSPMNKRLVEEDFRTPILVLILSLIPSTQTCTPTSNKTQVEDSVTSNVDAGGMTLC